MKGKSKSRGKSERERARFLPFVAERAHFRKEKADFLFSCNRAALASGRVFGCSVISKSETKFHHPKVRVK